MHMPVHPTATSPTSEVTPVEWAHLRNEIRSSIARSLTAESQEGDRMARLHERLSEQFGAGRADILCDLRLPTEGVWGTPGYHARDERLCAMESVAEALNKACAVSSDRPSTPSGKPVACSLTAGVVPVGGNTEWDRLVAERQRDWREPEGFRELMADVQQVVCKSQPIIGTGASHALHLALAPRGLPDAESVPLLMALEHLLEVIEAQGASLQPSGQSG
jgi:hypothetical protein